MADYYKQNDNLNGTSFVRVRKIFIDYPLNETIRAEWEEERIINLNDGTELNTHLGSFITTFNEADQIPEINPLTNELTGRTFTPIDMFIQHYSTYLYYAKKRDEGGQ